MDTQKIARLRDVFYSYIGCLAIFIIAVIISQYSTGLIGFIVYFVAGFYLTKVWLPRIIEFHPVWNTIDNQVGTKLRAMFFWPIFYLILLSKLGFLHAMR